MRRVLFGAILAMASLMAMAITASAGNVPYCC